MQISSTSTPWWEELHVFPIFPSPPPPNNLKFSDPSQLQPKAHLARRKFTDHVPVSKLAAQVGLEISNGQCGLTTISKCGFVPNGLKAKDWFWHCSLPTNTITCMITNANVDKSQNFCWQQVHACISLEIVSAQINYSESLFTGPVPRSSWYHCSVWFIKKEFGHLWVLEWPKKEGRPERGLQYNYCADNKCWGKVEINTKILRAGRNILNIFSV